MRVSEREWLVIVGVIAIGVVLVVRALKEGEG